MKSARVAATEKGVTEPQATFSTCFGAPFMPRHPTVYAKMLGDLAAVVGAGDVSFSLGLPPRSPKRHLGRALFIV